MATPDVNQQDIADRASNGDVEAVAALVLIHYRGYLEAVVRRNMPGSDDDDVEELLHEFYAHIVAPTAKGEWRLRKLLGERNPRLYIAHALDNFLHDTRRRRQKDPVGSIPYDDCRAGADTSADDTEAKLRKEKEIEIMLTVLAEADNFTARERYILFTFLLSEPFSGAGRPLKLRESLASQLGEPPSTVYNVYDRAIKRLRAHAAELMSRSL